MLAVYYSYFVCIRSVLYILYILAGTYAADCKCDNPHHCDGVKLDTSNARRCTATHRGGSSTRIRVSSKYIISV